MKQMNKKEMVFKNQALYAWHPQPAASSFPCPGPPRACRKGGTQLGQGRLDNFGSGRDVTSQVHLASDFFEDDWVIGLHYTFQDDQYLYMVMECAHSTPHAGVEVA